ncbi:MAG: SpoIIE family protein phosphatase [Ignavibacteriae bacterium]|nr:SpoIIE family protein phosphatase [Ignavibacteriota bacterium]
MKKQISRKQIMKLTRIVFLFIVLLNIPILSQSIDTIFVHSDSLKEKSISIDGLWRFHSGDNIKWASPTFDDSNWDTLNSQMNLDSIPTGTWKGIGWFRKVIKVSPNLTDSLIALRMEHYGASQIYLNGKSVHKFGKIGKNLEEEEIYQPWRIPTAIQLDSNQTLTIAVRYSNQKAIEDIKWYKRWFKKVGFNLSFADVNKKIKDTVQGTGISFAVNFGITGLVLSLSILYFFLFIFYSRRKENIYYSFFNLFIALVFATSMLRTLVHSNLTILYLYSIIATIAVVFIFTSYLGFLYTIFYEKMPKPFWFFVSTAVAILFSLFFYVPKSIIKIVVPAFIFVSTLEGLRIIILALKRKKDNAWVIGVGVIIFVILVITVFMLTLLEVGNINSITGVVLFFIGLISLPLSMSIYLARDIAKTNKDLEKQLITVQDLSAKELEHQKKAAKLELQAEKERVENERKTKELEEARQLQLSMLPKELPNLPHLDIAVYMQTATEVGGDYYDFHIGMDGILTTVIGDATGHGLNAGTVVTATKSLFSTHANNPDILFTFSEMTRVLKGMKLRMLSMCLSIVKIKGNQLTISSAGIPPALIYRSSTNEIEEFLIKGMPLGVKNGFPYEIRTTEISPGDTILLMSDGFPELFNKEKEMFGYDKVKNIFGEVTGKEPEEIIEHLKNTGSAWVEDAEPDDDVTFVVIKVK